jgi:hypothetical protein
MTAVTLPPEPRREMTMGDVYVVIRQCLSRPWSQARHLTMLTGFRLMTTSLF